MHLGTCGDLNEIPDLRHMNSIARRIKYHWKHEVQISTGAIRFIAHAT